MIDAGGIFWGGVLPVVVASTAVAICWKITRNAFVAWLLGISLGYLAGHWGLDSRGVGLGVAVTRSFHPHEARDWLPMAVSTATAIELVALVGNKGAVLAWILRVAGCVVLPWRLLAGSVYLPHEAQEVGFGSSCWSWLEAIAWLSGTSTLLLMAWMALWYAPKQTLPRLRSSLATFVALGATATIALSGSLTMGQLLGVLTAALVGCGVAASALQLESGPESAAGPLLAAFGGVLVIARFLLDPELPLPYSIILLLALVAAVGWICPPSRLPGRVHAAVRIALCLVALALTTVPAAQKFAASQAESETNPYLNFQP